MIEHEVTEQPNWVTKIVCTCGEQCSNWMEFYRHRGDAYRAQLLQLIATMPTAEEMRRHDERLFWERP